MRTTGRMVVEFPLRQPDPVEQPSLFEAGRRGELSIDERFAAFHAANPAVFEALRALALAEVERGARRVSVKRLYEDIRARSGGVAAGDEPYRLNNVFTSRYARLLSEEPRLRGRIEMRQLKAE